MKPKRKIEVFSAGCPVCQETIDLINRIACPSCEISILKMTDPLVAKRAQDLGVRSVPAVVVNGKLASCCEGQGPTEDALKVAGIGQSL